MNAIKKIDHIITERDRQDALRFVEAATLLAALPGMMSPAAREMASVRLRELSTHHPRCSEAFAAIVAHLESY
jgi:hypothetical protein